MRSRHTLAQLALDLVLVAWAWAGAFWLRFNLDLPDDYAQLAWQGVWVPLAAYALALLALRVDRHVWRYAGLPELRQLARALGLGAALTAAGVLMLRLPQFPRAVLLIHPLLVLVVLGAERGAAHGGAREPRPQRARGQRADRRLRAGARGARGDAGRYQYPRWRSRSRNAGSNAGPACP